MKSSTKTNNTLAFFKRPVLTEISAHDIEELRHNAHELARLRRMLQEQKITLEQLQNEISEYCAETHANVLKLQAKKITHPLSKKVDEHLAFYRTELTGAEQKLLEANTQLQQTENQIKLIEKEIPLFLVPEARK